MNSIELVKKAIEFKKPERIPLDFLPPRYSDFCFVIQASVSDTLPGEKSGTYTDVWGCTWKTVDKSMGRPFKSPLKKWESVKDFKFPDLVASKEYEIAKQVISKNPGKYIICLLYTSPSPRDLSTSRMPSSA